jgi:hypothetical protein
MWYQIVGDVRSYTMHAANIKDAWSCAMMELRYGFSGNRKVIDIKE